MDRKRIDMMSPATGRRLKEDDTPVNVADLLEAIHTVITALTVTNGKLEVDTELVVDELNVALGDVEALLGAVDAVAETDPTASANLNALIKGLLAQLQGNGTGSQPVEVTGSITGDSTSDSITRPNDTTAYAALDVVGENPAVNLQFDNVIPAAGLFVVLGARIRIDANAIPSGMTSFRLHLYNAAPTAIADNAAYNLPEADRGKYLGYVTLSTITDNGDTVWVQDDNLNFTGEISGTTLYGILQTVGAYTPSAQTVYTVMLNAAPV